MIPPLKEELNPGVQIIYVPDHAEGDINHPDCEPGFIASSTIIHGDSVFCRYWRKPDLEELRTLANSELTYTRCIVIRDSVPQGRVDEALKEIEQ